MADPEVNDNYDALDAAMASKKRDRDAALLGQESKEAEDLDDKVGWFMWSLRIFSTHNYHNNVFL